MSNLLSQEEWNRAMAIKEAVEASSEIQNRPDLEYAHLALCCSPTATMDQILVTAYKLQCFREHYRIQETVQDGVQSLRALMEQQPGHILDISYLLSEEAYNVVSDFAALYPCKVKSEADYRAYQAGFYYILRGTSTNIPAMRNGLIVYAECDGMSMQNVDVHFQERCVAELWSYYPAKPREVTWFNTPTAANFMYSMIRKLMTKEFRDKWKVGGVMEGYEGRLDALFTTPSLEAAQEQVLKKFETYLRERYENERTFRLTEEETTTTIESAMDIT